MFSGKPHLRVIPLWPSGLSFARSGTSCSMLVLRTFFSISNAVKSKHDAVWFCMLGSPMVWNFSPQNLVETVTDTHTNSPVLQGFTPKLHVHPHQEVPQMVVMTSSLVSPALFWCHRKQEFPCCGEVPFSTVPRVTNGS